MLSAMLHVGLIVRLKMAKGVVTITLILILLLLLLLLLMLLLLLLLLQPTSMATWVIARTRCEGDDGGDWQMFRGIFQPGFWLKCW